MEDLIRLHSVLSGISDAAAKQLAADTGINFGTLNLIRSGIATPNLGTVTAILQAYDLRATK